MKNSRKILILTKNMDDLENRSVNELCGVKTENARQRYACKALHDRLKYIIVAIMQ